MNTDIDRPRIEEYRAIINRNPLFHAVSDRCLELSDDPADQMYMVLWAPTLVQYVMWVLREAVNDGQQRLYFLSRDAYPMYLAARELAESLKLDIEIRYLRVSRYSLRLPEYHLMGIGCLERIFLSGIDVSMYRILNRAGLDESEMSVVCRELHYDRPLYENLNRREIIDLKAYVKKCCEEKTTSLLDRINRISAATYETALGYLEQEGLLDDIRYAVVDSGWVGTIQKSIQTILSQKRSGIIVTGYYFGLYEYPSDRSGCVYKAYYFMPKGSLGRKTHFSNCLYEVMYSEPCPMVKGYEEEDKNYRPVFSEVGSPNIEILQRDRDLLVIYVKTFAQELCRRTDGGWKASISGDDGRMTERLYSKLMSAPNRWEAAYYGMQSFSDDVADDHMRCIANRLSQEEIKDLRIIPKLAIAMGMSDKVIHESGWIEGTIVNEGHHIRSNLAAAHRAKYLTHFRQSLKAEKI